MSSLRTVLSPTTKPWRPLYVYAYCWLLPFSLSLYPMGCTSSEGHLVRRSTRATHNRRHSISPYAAVQISPNTFTSFRGTSSPLLAFLGSPFVERRPLATRPRWGRTTNGRGKGGTRGVRMMGKGAGRKKMKKLQKRQQSASTSGGRKGGVVNEGQTAVPIEDLSSNQDFKNAFASYEKVNAPKRVLKALTAARSIGTEDLLVLTAAAVCSTLRMDRMDLARDAIATLSLGEWEGWLQGNPTEARNVVRAACAATNPTFAVEILTLAEMSCADEAVPIVPEALEAAASVYPNLITAFSRKGQRDDAMKALEGMARAKLPIKVPAANRLLQGFHKRRDLEAVFKVLDAMAACGAEGDEETYEWLGNAAVKSVDFVTGAVSMETLPKAPMLPEAAFIGRSNVGKSSLINMVCNRKYIKVFPLMYLLTSFGDFTFAHQALAYTSKTPGKTQQFNYFVVNNSTESAFYLVDMPGLGYAKVPEKKRKEWFQVFQEYLTKRSSLKVLFHLIDGRHGPVGQDHTIMRMMKDLPDSARYVVALTKADKSANSVSREVLEGVVQALREAGVSRTPVVLTSASSRLGRDGMWRYLRLAALDREHRSRQQTQGGRSQVVD